MSETPQEFELTPEDHLSPDGMSARIADVAKARYMAEGMNNHETRAAALRLQIADTAVREANKAYDGSTVEFSNMGYNARNGKLTEEIRSQLSISDEKATNLADIYDALENTKR